MTGNLIEKITALVVEKQDLKEALKRLFAFSAEDDTVYYRDIVKLSALYKLIEFNKMAQLISSEDERDVREYLRINILDLIKEISKEQESILEENLRFIKREVNSIRELVLKYDEDEIVRSFNRLFLKIHSRHYKYFLRLISQDFDPSKSKIREYENEKVMSLVDLYEKILFEKELIHKEILKNEILTNKKVQEIIHHLINGKVDVALSFIESLSFEFIKAENLIPTNELRKPIELNYKYEELKYKQRRGVLSEKEYIIEIGKTIDEIFDFIEFLYLKDMVFVLTGEYKKSTQGFVNKNEKKEIKELLAKGSTKEAIDILLDKIPSSDSDLYNQILIQKARFSENKKQELLGLGQDDTLKNKIVLALLEIIDKI